MPPATRRISLTLIAAAAAALTFAAPAGADHGAIATSVSDSTISGTETTTARHGDPVAEFKSGGDEVTPSGGEASFAAALPSTCPAVNRSVDDAHNDPYGGTAPVVKVIYAYPVNVGNRLATYAPVIQAGARAINDFVTSESAGTLNVRFDIGTYEGPHCVDVQRIALPGTSDYYSTPNSDSFVKVASDVYARLGPQASKRNYLIYADGVTPAGIAGVAEAAIGAGFDDPGGAIHGTGSFFAVLFGRGGTDFFGSGTAFAPGQTSRTHLEIALHEATHNLGAVQQTAPNSSGTVPGGGPAGHCNDQFDLMCYEDGGSGSLFQSSTCDGPLSAPNDPYGPNFQAWDCNKDDYFNVAPPGASYLSTHWNLANSIYLCALASCAPPDQQAPNTKITRQPRKKTGKRKVRIEFSVTERSTTTCKLDRKPAKECDSPFKVKVKRGKHKIAVGATDAVGLTDSTPAKVKFKVVKP